MTDGQYLGYIFYVLQYLDGKITEARFKLSLSKTLLGLRNGLKYAFLGAEKKSACLDNLIQISELMGSFIDNYHGETGQERGFKLKSTRNFVPKIRGWYGPGNCFENLSFFEYRSARGHFRKYALDKDEGALNYMVATLYRPSRPFWPVRKYLKSCNGERRVTINSQSNPLFLKRRAKQISRAPFHVRWAVFLYFSACEDYLKTGRPIVDGNELDLSNLFTKQPDGDDRRSDVGLTGLLYSLAETGVFGNIAQTDDANLWDVMVRIYQVVMQMQQIEDKNKTR